MKTIRYLIQKTPIGMRIMPSNKGKWIEASDFDRVTAERDALQLRLNAVEEENDQLRIALNIQRIKKPDPPKIQAVDCEDCGDTGIEPCIRCAK